MSSPSLTSQQLMFIDSVLALKPTLAVFDCDGTLWSGDAGADFFYWEIEHGIVSREVGEWARERYKAYRAGKVSEEQAGTSSDSQIGNHCHRSGRHHS